MTSVQQTKLSDIVGALPEIRALSTQAVDEELFICANGFETRGNVVAAQLAAAGYHAKQAILMKYSANAEDSRANLPDLLTSLQAIAGSNIVEIDVDEVDVPRELSNVLQAIDGPSSAQAIERRVLFDMSVAANRVVVTCFTALLRSDISLRVAYAESGKYFPTVDEYKRLRSKASKSRMLEEGVARVVPNVLFQGQPFEQSPECVVVFPTFRADRSRAVLDKVDPALVSGESRDVVWMLGVPHLAEDHWRLAAMRELNGVTDEMVQYEISTFDYRETLQRLEQIAEEREHYARLTVSPLGSKLQAVGTSLWLHLHPQAKVLHAIPLRYNATHYSEGCKATWEIPFGSTIKLKSLLGRVGQIEIVEEDPPPKSWANSRP